MIPSSCTKLLLVLVVVVLTGCGGDGNSNDNGDNNTQNKPETSSEKWNDMVWDDGKWA